MLLIKLDKTKKVQSDREVNVDVSSVFSPKPSFTPEDVLFVGDPICVSTLSRQFYRH